MSSITARKCSTESNRCGVHGVHAHLGCSPSGMRQPSSSKTKWALPMMTFLPSTILEMPWATTYCTCEWYSSWVSPCRFAAAATVGAAAGQQAGRQRQRQQQAPYTLVPHGVLL